MWKRDILIHYFSLNVYGKIYSQNVVYAHVQNVSTTQKV